MQARKFLFKYSEQQSRKQRGVSLIITLLLLLLLTAMSLTMVLSVSSDMLINGYYRDFRGSFYAADSGANIARQAFINKVMADVNPGWGPAVAPLPALEPTVVQNFMNASYPTASSNSLNLGQGLGSWPEKFKVVNFALVKNPTTGVIGGCTFVGGPGGNCVIPVPAGVTGYQYIYNYQVTSVGQSQGTEATSLLDTGVVVFNGSITPAAPQKLAFSAWGMFIDQYPLCGNDLVQGTITGPVFTNGSWNFGTGSYTFTDPVGSVGTQACYNGVASNKTSANGVSPNFQQGLNLGSKPVPLPTDSFNQEQAVLDGIGNASGAPSQATLSSTLKNSAGVAYPSSGTVSSGVYLPYSINPSTHKATFTGGGILVQGDAGVTLSPSGTSGQTYTIVQGSVTTTVTIDPVANTTVISSGPTGKTATSSETITGVPDQIDPNTMASTPATMLYVNGNITSLTGPPQPSSGNPVPAIQNGTQLTITAAQSVTVTGDIRYTTEPVTMSGNPPDQLNASGDTHQVLGIFTAGGNVNLNNQQSSGNLEIDASIATISASGSGGIVNTGAAIKTLTIVGGRIQNTIQNINTTTRNVFFDRRFLNNGFQPPWFPSTTVQPGVGAVALSFSPAVQRTQWLNQTSSY